MKKALHKRNSVFLFLVMLSMVLMAACDSTPATPVPAPTATTAAVVAPTATSAAVAPAAPTATTAAAVATTAPTGKLGAGKAGTTVPITRSAPKGQLSTRSLGAGTRGADLNALEARNTPTPAAQATPTEEVPTQTGQAPDDWSVILDSDFSDGDPGTWLTGDAGDISSNIEGDALVMTAADGAGFYNWAEETDNWDDGYISATVKLDGAGVVGLTARLSKENDKFNDIVCVIATTGNYACYREIAGKNENMGSGRSAAIKKNAANELALLGQGEDFTFFINGKQVRTFSGAGVTDGSWGTYLESPAGETTSASFTHILFIGPGGDVTEPTPVVEDATATPEEVEPTATRAGRATATATAASGDEDVVVSTDFSQEDGSWLTGEGDTFSVAVTDGTLVVASTTSSGVVATAPEEAMDLTDARIEATFRIEDGSTDGPGWVGVSARSQEFASNFDDWAQVFCGINNAGDYSCNRLSMSSDGIEFKELLHGTTDSITDGEENTIALTSKGSRWTFEINGAKVGSFTDNSQKSGAWGVLVESGADSTTGYFSKVSIFNR